MRLFAKFASVGGATMASRVLGFVREALIAAALGAGPVADAFYAAFRFPNLFRRIFAEGAFNTAFVPLFSKQLEGEGLAAVQVFARNVLTLLVITLLFLSALAMIFMPALVATIIAPRFIDNPDKFNITVLMTRIMFPYLFFMSLTAMFSGIANSFRVYFLPALAPVLLNVVLIIVLLTCLQFNISPTNVGLFMAIGVTVSGLAQMLLLIMAVRSHGLSLKLKRPQLTPRVKTMFKLMLPAVLAGGITQINLLVGQIIASAQDGAIAILNYADRINQLPLGIVGIAIGVVLMPELSRALQAQERQLASNLQNRSIEFALALTLPAAIGFVLLPAPLVALVYERGAFTHETTQLTAAALAAYATGLPAYVLIKVLQPAYFAREDTRSPFWYSFVQIVVNILISLTFFPTYGYVAIAVATSISAWLNVTLLVAGLARQKELHFETLMISRVGKICVAGAAMGATVWGYSSTFLSQDTFSSTFTLLLFLLPAISIAAVCYFFLLQVFGVLNFYKMLKSKKFSG